MPVEHFTWADKIAAELHKKSKKHVVHGMWTPSGFFHIGNARSEVLMPGLVARAVEDAGMKVEFNLFSDDFDDLDAIPAGLDVNKKDFEQYMGKPMYEVPSPVAGYKSWADFFTSDIKENLAAFGLHPEWYSSYENYKRGIYDEAIRIVLNNARKTRDVLVRISKTQKTENWIPIMVICENCSRSSTTTATGWDGEKLSYVCNQDRPYAQACKYQGEVVPEKGNAKLPWRVHWPATWFIFGVTFESAGKDHFAAGGSVDTGQAICREIFGKEPPLQAGVEFAQIDGKKISGSKGNGVSMTQWLEFAEPELLRFLYISYQPNTVINIDVRNQKFFLVTDRYDEAERCYYGQQSVTEKRTEQLKRIYEISQTGKPKDEMPVQVPFASLVMFSQVIPEVSANRVVNLLQKMGAVKRDPSAEDMKRIERRLSLATNWVEKYAQDDSKIRVNSKAPVFALEKSEKSALSDLADELKKTEKEEELQAKIYDIARSNGVEPKKFFRVLYSILISKDAGPRLAPFMLAIGREKVGKLLEAASE